MNYNIYDMEKIIEYYNESPTKAKTRQKILVAAKELFSELGIEGTTMLQISEKAGITARNLYRYYVKKDLLVVDVAYLVFTTNEKIEDIPFDMNKTGFELFRESLNILFVKKNSAIYDISTIKFLIEFDLYILNMDKKSEAYKKYQKKHVFMLDDQIKEYLSKVLIKGLKDGSIVIPIQQLDFYIDFIIQSFVSIIMGATIREPLNEEYNYAFVEKQIEMLLHYIKSSA